MAKSDGGVEQGGGTAVPGATVLRTVAQPAGDGRFSLHGYRVATP